MKTQIFVESGHKKSSRLIRACRRGFTRFFAAAGASETKVDVVACGNKSQAYNQFFTAAKRGYSAILLIDSDVRIGEEYHFVQEGQSVFLPWQFLLESEEKTKGWYPPKNLNDTDSRLHFMVTCMENWLLADRENLRAYFDSNFNEKKLIGSSKQVETVIKEDALKCLNEASKGCNTTYNKSDEAYELLQGADPATVEAASLWAARLLNHQRQL